MDHIPGSPPTDLICIVGLDREIGNVFKEAPKYYYFFDKVVVRTKFNVESKVLSIKFRKLIVPSVSEDCWWSINMPPFWRAIWHYIYMKYMLTLRASDSAPSYTHWWYFYTDPEGCVQRRTRV